MVAFFSQKKGWSPYEDLAKAEQAVSCRELWHETETNPVRIRGGGFGRVLVKKELMASPTKKCHQVPYNKRLERLFSRQTGKIK